MFRSFFVLVVFFNIIFAQEVKKDKPVIDIDNSFITKFEYGKMLYHNQRGIGCNKCHGEKAEGKKIVDFKHTYNKKEYLCSMIIPSITETSYEVFSKKVNQKRNPNKKFPKDKVCDKLVYYENVMPTYFLVEDEIEAIFYYIKNLK